MKKTLVSLAFFCSKSVCAVCRGVEFLDRNCPGWFMNLKPSRIWMMDQASTMVALLFPSLTKGDIKALVLRMQMPQAAALFGRLNSSFGVQAGFLPGLNEGIWRAILLTMCWRTIIWFRQRKLKSHE